MSLGLPPQEYMIETDEMLQREEEDESWGEEDEEDEEEGEDGGCWGGCGKVGCDGETKMHKCCQSSCKCALYTCEEMQYATNTKIKISSKCPYHRGIVLKVKANTHLILSCTYSLSPYP